MQKKKEKNNTAISHTNSSFLIKTSSKFSIKSILSLRNIFFNISRTEKSWTRLLLAQDRKFYVFVHIYIYISYTKWNTIYRWTFSSLDTYRVRRHDVYLSFRNVRKFSHVPRCALRGLLQEFNLRCQVIPARENVYWIRRWRHVGQKGEFSRVIQNVNLRFHVVNTRQGGGGKKKNLWRSTMLRTANTPRYKSCAFKLLHWNLSG